MMHIEQNMNRYAVEISRIPITLTNTDHCDMKNIAFWPSCFSSYVVCLLWLFIWSTTVAPLPNFFPHWLQEWSGLQKLDFSFATNFNQYLRRVRLPAWALRCSLRLSFLVNIFPQRLQGKMVLGDPGQFLFSACCSHLGLLENSLPQEEQITRSFPDSFTTKVWAYRCL